jgi:hypothetical protein
VNSSDTLGCLESGFALAVEAIIATLAPEKKRARHAARQVTVLASSMLTPANLDAIREWIGAFGLMIPDIGDSLDGHTGGFRLHDEEGYSALTYGGVSCADIARRRAALPSMLLPSARRRSSA